MITTTGIVLSTLSTTTITTTTTTSTNRINTTAENHKSSEQNNQWLQPMIIGIVIGSLVIVLVIVLSSYIYCTRVKKGASMQPLILGSSEQPFTTIETQEQSNEIPSYELPVILEDED